MPMTFQPPYRPSGRSVWLGKDLVQTDDWIVRLSPATLEEIAAAVSRLRGRNAYDTPVAREEFPLISATSAIFWSTAASGAAISQAASRPRTPAGRSASSPCSA